MLRQSCAPSGVAKGRLVNVVLDISTFFLTCTMKIKKTSNVIFFSPLALILVHNLHMYHNFILIFSFYLIVETVVGISTFDTLDTIGVCQQ